jgi:hypothetical protein
MSVFCLSVIPMSPVLRGSGQHRGENALIKATSVQQPPVNNDHTFLGQLLYTGLIVCTIVRFCPRDKLYYREF